MPLDYSCNVRGNGLISMIDHVFTRDARRLSVRQTVVS